MATSVNFGTQQYFGFDPRTIPGCALWLDAADRNTNLEMFSISRTNVFVTTTAVSVAEGGITSVDSLYGGTVVMNGASIGTGGTPIDGVWARSATTGRWYAFIIDGSFCKAVLCEFVLSGPLPTLTLQGISAGFTSTVANYLSANNSGAVNDARYATFSAAQIATSAATPDYGVQTFRMNIIRGANATAVGAWSDKSGNGRDAIANIAVTWDANGLGTGYPALAFPAAARWLEGPMSITGTSSLSVFSVFSMSASSAFAARLLSLAATNVPDYNTTAYVGILRQSSTNMGPFRNSAYAGAATPYDTPLLNTSFVEGTTLSGATNGGTAVTAGTSTANFNISAYRVGNTTENADTGAGRFQGFIGEIITYSRSLTLPERQQVEGYLAHKWGLRPSLPAIHPFSVRPVTNRVFQPVDLLNCALWLDAADEPTVMLNGTTVVGWRDKSGTNSHSYAVNVNVDKNGTPLPPNGGTYVRDVYKGNNCIRNPLDIRGSIGRSPSVALTVFAVGTVSTASSVYWSMFALSDRLVTSYYDAGGMLISYYGGFNPPTVYGFMGGGNMSLSFAIPGGLNSRFAMVCQQNGSLTTTYGNGTLIGSTTTTATTYNYDHWWVGFSGTAVPSGVNGWLGDVCEIIVFNRALPLEEIQRVDGYLTEKWGFSSSLPIIHPYRAKALPSTTLFTPQSLAGLQVWTDASTLTEASGTALSTWANGGSFGTVNCTGTVQREQLNQLPVVRFTTAQRWAPASTLNLSAYTLCFVTRLTSIPVAPSGRVLRHVVNGTNNQLYGYWQGFKGSWFVDGANTNAGLYTQLADTQWDLCTHTRTAGGASLFRWNGVEFFRRTSSSGSGMAGLQINPTGDSENTACEVAEIFVYNSVLPLTQLQVIEGYLATKWGIQSRIAIYNNPLFLFPVFVPLALSSARIWVTASTLTQANGVALTTWPNIGSGGPTVNCTGVVFTNQLNGQRVVRFTTAQTWTTSPLINYSSYTLMFVARLTGTTNRRVFVTNTTNQLFGYWNGFKRAIYGDGAFGPTQLETVPADTSWDIITLTRVSGGAFTFRWNGNLLFSGSASPGVGLAGLAINAGAFGVNESSTCEVAEVIVVDSVLPDSQIIGMEEYLSFTWGIPISRRHGYSLFRA